MEPFLWLYFSVFVFLDLKILVMKSACAIVGIFCLLMGASYYFSYTPLAIAVLLFCLSILSYFYYARDKKAARSGAWRVPENTLHLLSLCGGWSGALLAQQKLRHKTQKTSFRVVFWLTVLLNVGGLAWLHSAGGERLLKSAIGGAADISRRYINSDELVSWILFIIELRET